MNPTPGMQMPKPGEYIVFDAEHYSRERIEIDASAGVLLAGQVMARLNTGYWVAYNPAGSGGANVARGILFENVLAAAGAVRKAAASVRHTRVKPDKVFGLDAAAIVDLANNGILSANGINNDPSLKKMTWAQVQLGFPASPDNAGMQVWCTDYPSVSGHGALIMSNGVRWKAVSQQYCLLSPPSAPDGFEFAAGSGNTLYGTTVLIPGGVMQPDDNLRIVATLTNTTTATSQFRGLRLNVSGSAVNVPTGTVVNQFAHTGINTQITVDKISTWLSTTRSRYASSGSPGSALSTAAHLVTNLSGLTLNDPMYMGVVVQAGSDTAVTMFAATVFLEYGR